MIRFTALRSEAYRMRPIQATVWQHLQDEGGCWTAAGIAEVIGMDSRDVSCALQRLKVRGKVRVVSMKPQRGGVALYEVAT